MSYFSCLLPPVPSSAHLTQTWLNLKGSSIALSIATLAEQSQQPIIIITSDAPTANRLHQEILFFLSEKPQFPVQLIPGWESLPYDTFSPHQDIISERLRVFSSLPNLTQGVIILSLNTAILRLAPQHFIQSFAFNIHKNEHKPLTVFRAQLEQAGYRSVHQVMEHGEYSIRGSIFDIFPMGSKMPYRLDYFDDQIDSIRQFDPETQRSSEPIDKVQLLPAKEFPTHSDGIDLFRSQFRALFSAQTAKESIYQQVSEGVMPSGIEYYLPLFFESTATIFDYLPQNSILLTEGSTQAQLDYLWDDIRHRYEERRWDKERPILPPQQLFIQPDEFSSALKPLPKIRFNLTEQDAIRGPVQFQTDTLPNIYLDVRVSEPLKNLQTALNEAWQAQARVLIVVESAGRRESVLSVLRKHGQIYHAESSLMPTEFDSFDGFMASEAVFGITQGQVTHSFILSQAERPPLWLITETELLGHRPTLRKTNRKGQANTVNPDAIIRNLAELSIGQPVVHFQHGIGQYQGLNKLQVNGIEQEFLTLHYANETRLYVPVSSLHLISRYSGADADKVALNRLGSEQWQKTRQKAAEKIRDVAAELLDIYAQREAKPGFAFKLEPNELERFSAGFAFTETEDQNTAITAVLNDMQQPQAMDRLVCGDVGFGKTEVAMRAAFVAVHNHKQVAVLVPTTLLAQQHYDSFLDRFADWPVRIEVLSRFRSTKQTQETLAAIESGQVDIVIGTHKLLQEKIKFADLGLLIVDEEHRFGVRQKERIKQMRAEVDILTLTATPIPRTLNMAMNQIRDLSIIATPPARRLAVKTFVREYDKATIREAILRETLRGGQVYYLHNNVSSIETTAEHISELVPEANIRVAHGQMGERELESIMADFYHQRFNVLVCTTIIETGIDIPTANTILIDRADRLGLAQLHQLRGRVGRSHHQAYAYLLTPHPKRMTKDAIKRLDAISNLEALGAGFILATHDLEIRGAGELLGDDQSGQIESIGFSLYMEMLDETVQALQAGREPSLDSLIQQQTEIDCKHPALFPEDYIYDINTRLSLYKRIASAKTIEALDEIQVELIDRFGLLPTPTKHLFELAELRVEANQCGIDKIELGPLGGQVVFNQQTNVEPVTIIQLLQTEPQNYAMAGATQLKINAKLEDIQARVKLLKSLLNKLQQGIEQAKGK